MFRLKGKIYKEKSKMWHNNLSYEYALERQMVIQHAVTQVRLSRLVCNKSHSWFNRIGKGVRQRISMLAATVAENLSTTTQQRISHG
jgi:hypothetical protein